MNYTDYRRELMKDPEFRRYYRRLAVKHFFIVRWLRFENWLDRTFRRPVTDGFGNYWPRYCTKCGGEMQVVRPGSARCSRCEN